MKIRQIDTHNPNDVRAFIQFPFTLYQDHPLWVPPLKVLLRQTIRNNPKKIEVKFFVIESENQILGRIGFYLYRNNQHERGFDSTYFFLFDSINDINVAQLLFDSLFDFSVKKSITKIIGPKPFVSYLPTDTLVYGFDEFPAFNSSYNFSYYEKLITSCGFEKLIDHNSAHLDIKEINHVAIQLLEIISRKNRFNFSVNRFNNYKDFFHEAKRIYPLYYKSMQTHPDEVLSFDTYIQSIKKIAYIFDKRFVFTIDKSNERIWL